MYLKISKIVSVLEYFIYTLICGLIPTFIQIYEYIYASFTIADSVYGSVFYLLTGFHGFHVFAGSIFILVCFIRTIIGHFTKQHHVGFECAA
jgi:heme/copper-type cytochrome/quinol oxidase subunit 3